MHVVFGDERIGVPDSIWGFRGSVGDERDAAVAGKRGEDNAVGEGYFAVADCEGREELGGSSFRGIFF